MRQSLRLSHHVVHICSNCILLIQVDKQKPLSFFSISRVRHSPLGPRIKGVEALIHLAEEIVPCSTVLHLFQAIKWPPE